MAFHRITWWQKSLIVVLTLTTHLGAVYAQSEAVQRLSRFEGSLPTGLEVILGEASDNSSGETRFLPGDESKFVFFLDGSFQGQLSSQDSIDKLLQGAVAATFQIQVGALSAEARLNLQNMINQALEGDHRDRGSVQSNGVVDIADPLFVEKLVASVALIEVPSKDEKVALFYLKAGAGRDEIYAAKIMPWQRAMDLFGQERLTQTDQVFVEAAILSKLYIRAAAFGFDWIGFPIDEDNRPDLEGVEQDGEGSWSLSVAYDASKLVEKIGGQLEFSILFADVKEGYFNPNRPVDNQVDDYRLYAARGDFKVEKLSVSLEGFYRDSNQSEVEAEWGVVAQVGYQLTDRFQLMGEVGHLDRGSLGDTQTFGGGVTYSLFDNVKAYAMLRHDLESEETTAWIGVAVEGAVYNVNEDRIRHVAMAQQIGRSE